MTVLCGILFLVIGRFRLGGLIRFVPYPVVGGFLAGTGWLLGKVMFAVPDRNPLASTGPGVIALAGVLRRVADSRPASTTAPVP